MRVACVCRRILQQLGETEERHEDLCEGSLCLPQDPAAGLFHDKRKRVSTPNSEVNVIMVECLSLRLDVGMPQYFRTELVESL